MDWPRHPSCRADPEPTEHVAAVRPSLPVSRTTTALYPVNGYTFRNPEFSDELAAKMLGLKSSGAWKLPKARKAVMAEAEWENSLTRILYRPFDTRDDLFAQASGGECAPNFPDWLLPRLREAYGDISPEDVFHYIYAVLYSPPYRERYNEFLKSDFPRIPFAADAEAFRALAAVGAELVALHLLKSPALDAPITKFRVPGDNHVAKNKAAGRRYDADAQRVYINKEQYFDNIPEHLWTYRIGGYQVLDKWLKDRAERRLTPAEVRHYCRTATALAETLKLQQRLAELYPAVEKETIALGGAGE